MGTETQLRNQSFREITDRHVPLYPNSHLSIMGLSLVYHRARFLPLVEEHRFRDANCNAI